VLGFEQLVFLSQTRTFCAEAARILGRLPPYFNAVERDFGAEMAAEIEAQLLAPDRILGSRALTLDRVMAMIEGVFGRLAADDRAVVQQLLATEYQRKVAGDLDEPSAGAGSARKVTFSPVPGFPELLSEPELRWRPIAITLASGRLLGPSEDQIRTAVRWAEVTADLDQTTSLPSLLDKLAALTAETKARTAAPGGS